MSVTVVKTPPEQCLYPVAGKYACLEYGFESSDAVLSDCTFASAIITVSGGAIPLGEGFTLGIDGSDITLISGTGILDGYTIINPPPIATPSQLASAIIDALNSNAAISSKYNIAIIPSLPTTATIRLTAKECGSQCNVIPSNVWNGLTITNTDGLDTTYKEDHGIKLSIFCIEDGEEKHITDKHYPTKVSEDGTKLERCINLASVLCNYLDCQYPSKSQTQIEPVKHVVKEFKVYYSEVFSTPELNGGKPQCYFNIELDSFFAINGAAQKKNPVDYTKFESGQFLTNMPLNQDLCVCCDACLWLTFLAKDATSITGFIEAHYKDGSTQTVTIDSVVDSNCLLYRMPIFLCDVLNNDEIVDFDVWIEIDGTPTQTASFRIFDSCNQKQEFYFFNDVGGIDTIYFDCQTIEQIDVTNNNYCEVIQCGQDSHRGGRQQFSSQANNSFSAVSQRHYKYQDREWLKEFYRSKKWTEEDGQICAITSDSGSYLIAQGGNDNIVSQFNYRTNVEYATN